MNEANIFIFNTKQNAIFRNILIDLGYLRTYRWGRHLHKGVGKYRRMEKII